jgi:hypothetical protein
MVDKDTPDAITRTSHHWYIDAFGVVAVLLALASWPFFIWAATTSGNGLGLFILGFYALRFTVFGFLLQLLYLLAVIPVRKTWGSRWVLHLQMIPLTLWILPSVFTKKGSYLSLLDILELTVEMLNPAKEGISNLPFMN